MLSTAKILVLSTVITLTLSETCVLEKLVTINQPLCPTDLHCTASANKTRNKRDAESFKTWPLVAPGSPSAQHFQSVSRSNGGSLPLPMPTAKSDFVLDADVNLETNCNGSDKYRSYDGLCNNLVNSTFGQANTPFLRILEPRYLNETTDEIAVSTTGQSLPNARLISTTIFPSALNPWVNFTLAVMQWGQLIAHDIGLSPAVTNLPVNCCSSEIQNSTVCLPIEIPKNDKFFSKFGQTCMNMIRTSSTQVLTGNCQSIVSQINGATHYIDLSHIYGSDFQTASTLRQFENGLLDVYLTNNSRQFPKLSNDPVFECSSLYSNLTCFHSGDRRVNQNTQLTCLQTVLIRQHNKIAEELGNLNPSWNDETLFQETRNILIAMFQHISYYEWLPLILGKDYLKKHDLESKENGFFEGYSKDLNAGTINSFMAGAYRIFHAQIQGQLFMYDAKRCPFRSLNISNHMNRPKIITEGENLDALLKGLTIEFSEKIDRFVTDQMTDYMFHLDLPYGEDLISFDIQRGRDHGIPTYNNIRTLCGFKKANNFSDLSDLISEEKINLMMSLYNSVDDIDFYVGTILETWQFGAALGPTAQCIIGEQFARKKIGDRFWYENGDQIHSFTKDQLQEIRKITFSRLLCDNADNITDIQPNSFFSSSIQGNKIVPCSQIPSINLTKWKV